MGELADLPFRVDAGVTGMDPNEETVAVSIIRTEVGDEEIGPETSFIELIPLSIPQRTMADTAVPGLVVFSSRASCNVILECNV